LNVDATPLVLVAIGEDDVDDEDSELVFEDAIELPSDKNKQIK